VKRFCLISAAAAGAALLVASGFAAGSMTMTVSPSGKIASQARANVSVSVTCAPLDPQTGGSLVVSLTQLSGSKTASGTGSTPIVCDGQSHTYAVQVTATDGRWHNGSAVASATGSASGWQSTTACGTDSSGQMICVTGTAPATDAGSAGPSAIVLGTD
jgi:hypothetical protein